MTSQRTVRRRRNRRRKESGISPLPSTTGTYSELTVPGNYAWGGVNYQEIINIKPVRHDEIQLMMDMDGHARALFNAFRRPIIRNAQRAFVKPPGKGIGKEETDFIASNLLSPRHEGGTTIPFIKTAAAQCMAMLFGFKAFEKVHDRPGTVVDDGKNRLRKLAPRDARVTTFLVDDNGGFDGIRIRTGWKGRTIDKKLKKERSVYFAVDEEETPFYGKSLFLPSYYHFDKKHKLYYITHLALAVGALSPRLAKAEGAVSDKDKKTFLEALSNLGTNAAMLVPQGFELLENKLAGNTGRLPFMDMIRHHDLMMSQSVLAQVIDVGTSERGGGFSLSKNHLDLLFMFLESMQYDMGEMYNNFIIPELIDWNFGSGFYPRVQYPPISDDIKKATADVFSRLIVSREKNLSPEFSAEIEKEMADVLGLEVPPERIDAHQARIIAREDIEQAMAQANDAVGKNTANMTVMELLESPEFITWSEQWSEKVRERQAVSVLFGEGAYDGGDVDV